MPSYGYMVYRFNVHRHGKAGSPLRLGTLEDPNEPGDAGTDALDIVYGILQGMVGIPVTDAKSKHLTIETVTGVGRCVRFTCQLGQSGQESQISDPEDTESPAFRRTARHVEAIPSRGMLIVPNRSVHGLMVIEAHGRRTGRELFQGEVKRLFRVATSETLIMNFTPAIDEVALAQYLANAQVNSIGLRRNTIPKDLAEVMEMEQEEKSAGTLNMKVQGRFKRDILHKLQQNAEARRRMLTVDGLEFDELNVKVQVGDRQTTVSVTGDQMPMFINVIDPKHRPPDDRFYSAVQAEVPQISRGLNVQLTGDWASRPWSEERKAFIIERPQPGGPDDESEGEGA